MKRVQFPGAQRRTPAPNFRLDSAAGEPVALADYRDRSNLVLFFAGGVDDETLRRAMDNFQARRFDYQAQNARVLAIVDAPRAETPAGEGAEGRFAAVLADPGGATRATYAGLLPGEMDDGAALFFVLDRYGTPHVAFLSDRPDDPAIQDEFIDWLFGIELECPE